VSFCLARRRHALALAFLIERGDVPAVWPVARALCRLGVRRSTAYRWQGEYRAWLEAGAP